LLTINLTATRVRVKAKAAPASVPASRKTPLPFGIAIAVPFGREAKWWAIDLPVTDSAAKTGSLRKQSAKSG
jgi:hypothetical protein